MRDYQNMVDHCAANPDLARISFSGCVTGRISAAHRVQDVREQCAVLPPSCQRTADEKVARARLGKFVVKEAHRYERLTGLKYEENDDLAANSYLDLIQNVRNAINTGAPVYVMRSEASHSIYGSECEYVVWALRYWHEMLHYLLAQDFSLEGELAVSQAHVDATEQEFGKGSLEAKLMWSETFGQVLHYTMHGEFCKDQAAFTDALMRQY